MTSTTGTTTTSRTRTNKRSTSRITGLKAVSEQTSQRCPTATPGLGFS
jgi:hypothetical protein